ncbi:MFS transporter [Effusibacillus pohliae]|uniref:MFS transporter n=1 Tax=Effusibacillus pohliae TaxID=232270 RepID=UPI0003676F37|nr:MFS transporter [Effusibacillus pohliae]
MTEEKQSFCIGKLNHFHLLVAGKTISDIGSSLDMVALNLYVYILTGSAFQMGIFMAVRLLGGFLAGFYSGVLADRMNRKSLMILSDVVRSIALLALVLSPADWQLPLLYMVAAVTGVFGSMFNVALQSSIPVIAKDESLIKANALINSLQSVSLLIGTLTAGIMLSFFSYQTIFAVDAISYLVSAANLLWLPIRTSENRHAAHAKASLFKEVGTTYLFLRALPVLLAVMFIRMMDTFGSGSHNVGIPVYSTRLDPDHPSLYMGLIWTCWAIGYLIASRGMAKWFKPKSEAQNEFLFGISTFLMSLFFILVFVDVFSYYLILLFACLAGISDGVSSICFNSRLQMVTDEKRGRVIGVSTALLTIGFGVGMVISSLLFDKFEPIVVVGLLHGIPMVMALGYTLYFYGKWKSGFRKATGANDMVEL